jgi:diguanylate cyclase (GGDEF)-like protein
MSYVRAQRVAFQTAQHAQARLARRDPLTGLGNRRDFDETLEAEIARARRAGMKLSIALLDLDGFKALNDELGHLEGDRCLRAVAAQLDARRRRDDPIFRWGGDEFALILSGADHAQARNAVERLSRFESEIVAGDGRPVKLCTGIAEYEDGITPEDLLERADIDLFGAKDKVRRRARRSKELAE